MIVFYAVVTAPYAHALVSISPGAWQVSYGTGDWGGYVPGELIIGLGGQSNETLQRVLDSWHAKIVGELPEIQASLVRLSETGFSATLSEMEAYAGFEYVEPNYYVHAALTPNDPLWSSQWGLPKVRADLAWDIEVGVRSVTVAVIDTGIDYNHEDLAENYLPSGYDWVNHDNDPWDDMGHGTHVAGIIGAVTNNGVGVAGLAQVSMMAEKVLDQTGAGTIFDVAQGVIDAAKKGARITNNSYETGVYSDTMRAAFEYAWSRGVLNVAAAGNDNSNQPFYPAAFTEFVVSAAGTNQTDGRYSSSNYGDWIELSAPAVGIVSTLPGNSYGSFTGTSMSSAFVTGAAALMWSRCGAISADQVRRRLQETAVDLGAPGRDLYFGYGRIDVFSALDEMPCPAVGGRILEPQRTQLPLLLVSELIAVAVAVTSIALLRDARRSSRRKTPPKG
jgi:subtilisin family serine protease